MHIVSGDRWAGAEMQAFTLLSQLRRDTGVQLLAVLLNPGELAERLSACGIEVVILDERLLSSWRIGRELHRLMRHWQPHIVHTHRMKENILGSISNRLAGNAPSVRTVHGAPEHRATGWRQWHKALYQALDRWCGRHLQQGVIAVSRELAEKLAVDYPSESIAVVENGIDISAIRAQMQPVTFRTEHPNAIHVGLVGRLEAVKRVDIFIGIAARLSQQHPERTWLFHVFGDGSLKTALTAQAAREGLAQTLCFHGHRQDIVACIAGLDALVICSDHEGLPMNALEAVAVGTPVVAHATGGLIDLLSGDAGGLLVNPHAVDRYATVLLATLANERTAMMASGLQRLQQRFSSAVNADNTLAQYHRLRSH